MYVHLCFYNRYQKSSSKLLGKAFFVLCHKASSTPSGQIISKPLRYIGWTTGIVCTRKICLFLCEMPLETTVVIRRLVTIDQAWCAFRRIHVSVHKQHNSPQRAA